jgi:hypothetical protein
MAYNIAIASPASFHSPMITSNGAAAGSFYKNSTSFQFSVKVPAIPLYQHGVDLSQNELSGLHLHLSGELIKR